MDARNTPVTAGTSACTRRSILRTMLLPTVAGLQASGFAALDGLLLRSAPMGVFAEAETRDIKPSGDDTDEPPGELPVIVVDDPADDDRRG
jgi:hypothetical protein